jgi:hypothetical protein
MWMSIPVHFGPFTWTAEEDPKQWFDLAPDYILSSYFYLEEIDPDLIQSILEGKDEDQTAGSSFR